MNNLETEAIGRSPNRIVYAAGAGAPLAPLSRYRSFAFWLVLPPVGGPGKERRRHLFKATTKGTYLPPPVGGSRYVVYNQTLGDTRYSQECVTFLKEGKFLYPNFIGPSVASCHAEFFNF